MSEKWISTSLPYVLPRRPGDTDAWTEDSASKGGSQELTEVATAAPPPEIAALLGTAEGDLAVLRRRIMRMNGDPVELVDSWYPRPIAEGTPLAERRKIRGGAPTLLAALGHHVRRVIEETGIRAATAAEADRLNINESDNVLTLTRVSLLEGDHPLEASLMVMKGPRQIRYEIEVD